MQVSTPEEEGREKQERRNCANAATRREIPVQGQGISEPASSAADRETFNGSCSEFRVSPMSCCAMKKQGHSDRYHEVTPMHDCFFSSSLEPYEGVSFMATRNKNPPPRGPTIG